MLARVYGCVFFASFGMLAPFLLGANSLAAEPSPAGTNAANAASAAPCASDGPDARDLPAAYAYDLESPAVLRFVRFVTAVPELAQKRIFDAAIASANDGPQQDVRAAVASRCPRPDAAYGTLRATYGIVNDWTLGELKDAARFQAFDAVVATAVSALSLGDEITPEQRMAAIRPFDGFDLQAPAQPSPSASGHCTSSNARTLTVARPAYPPNAVFAATTGKVFVKVLLSDTGDVRSASLFRDTLGNAIGGEEIRRETIFAAASTTYAPGMRDCVPRQGAYLFESEFTGH